MQLTAILFQFLFLYIHLTFLGVFLFSLWKLLLLSNLAFVKPPIIQYPNKFCNQNIDTHQLESYSFMMIFWKANLNSGKSSHTHLKESKIRFSFFMISTENDDRE